jgi:predicted  nucleic acid-binding Zn-ribbon protein
METELDSLRSEVRIRADREVALETEVSQLRATLTKVNAERDNYMRRAEAIKSILDQTGSGLVNAMRVFHASERELQEQALGADSEPPPRFISEGSKALHAVG